MNAQQSPATASLEGPATAEHAAVVRRFISMSQWVRGGLLFLASGWVPSTSSASAPHTRHSHTTGTSASTENGIVK